MTDSLEHGLQDIRDLRHATVSLRATGHWPGGWWLAGSGPWAAVTRRRDPEQSHRTHREVRSAAGLPVRRRPVRRDCRAVTVRGPPAPGPRATRSRPGGPTPLVHTRALHSFRAGPGPARPGPGKSPGRRAEPRPAPRPPARDRQTPGHPHILIGLIDSDRFMDSDPRPPSGSGTSPAFPSRGHR